MGSGHEIWAAGWVAGEGEHAWVERVLRLKVLHQAIQLQKGASRGQAGKGRGARALTTGCSCSCCCQAQSKAAASAM